MSRLSPAWALALLSLLGCGPGEVGQVQLGAYLGPVPVWTQTDLEADAALGVAVALGDFDGDGSLDTALGLPGSDAGAFGVGTVSISYDPLGQDLPQVLAGVTPYGFFGSALAVGDANGDGLDDLAVGAPGESGVPGAVYLFLGDVAGLGAGATSSSDASAVWVGEGADQLGLELAWGEDLSGDGSADLVAGAPGGGPLGQGRVVGLTPADPSLPAWSREGDEAGERFGAAVAVGDVTGDGLPDLAVGAPLGAGSAGRASVFAGGGGVSATPTWTEEGSAGQLLGTDLTILDLDASGLGDLVVGAPGALGGRGMVRVHRDAVGGGSVGVHAGPAGNGSLGASLAVGDLDADGTDDLVIGRPGAGGPGAPLAGGLSVIAGSPTAPSADADLRHDGGVGLSRLGTSLAVGDLDGDGYADVLAGGFLATTTGAIEAGAAWVFPGLPATADADQDGFCADVGPCAAGVPTGDCDDTNPWVAPGAPEMCDGLDTDCDGVVPSTEADLDGDGFSPCDGDCSEGDPTIHPLSPEQCDPIDHDCDGLTDNGVTPDPRYRDVDGDGVGAGAAVAQDCVPPLPGFSALDTDCDDADPAVFPGAAELLCNGVDDDCSPFTEDTLDNDGDGALPCDDCTFVGGDWVCGDCDDADRLIRPGARERCEDGIDQDCDGRDAVCDIPEPCPEPDRRCEEPAGCAVAGTSPAPTAALLFVALLGVRRRRWAGLLSALGAVAVLAGPASAQEPWDAEGQLDTQLLRPTFAPWGFVSSTGADPGLGTTIRGGVISQYEHAPFALLDDAEEVERIVRHRVTHTVGGWVTPVDRVGFGIALPIVIHDADWTEEDWTLRDVTLGDLEVDTLVRVLRSGSAALALGARVWMPTAGKHSLAGEALPRVEGRLAGQGSVGPLTGLVEVRALLRQRIHTGYDFDLAPELALLGAVRVWPVPGKVSVSVELESRGSTAAFLKRGAENPLDARGLVRVHPARGVTIEVGGGLGLNAGYGAPLARAILGVTVGKLPAGRPLETGASRIVREEPDDLFEDDDFDELDEPDILWVGVEESAPEGPEEPEDEGPLAELIAEQIVIHAPIDFAYDSDELLASSLPVLEEVRTILKAHPDLAHVLIEGHASLEGRTTYNWDLSNRRAAAVFRWLVESGVSSARLSYRGMGEAIPRGTDTGAKVREEDRRVEFHVVERLDTLLDDVPDWEAEAPPIPWLMEEVEPDED